MKLVACAAVAALSGLVAFVSLARTDAVVQYHIRSAEWFREPLLRASAAFCRTGYYRWKTRATGYAALVFCLFGTLSFVYLLVSGRY